MNIVYNVFVVYSKNVLIFSNSCCCDFFSFRGHNVSVDDSRSDGKDDLVIFHCQDCQLHCRMHLHHYETYPLFPYNKLCPILVNFDPS